MTKTRKIAATVWLLFTIISLGVAAHTGNPVAFNCMGISILGGAVVAVLDIIWNQMD